MQSVWDFKLSYSAYGTTSVFIPCIIKSHLCTSLSAGLKRPQLPSCELPYFGALPLSPYKIASGYRRSAEEYEWDKLEQPTVLQKTTSSRRRKPCYGSEAVSSVGPASMYSVPTRSSLASLLSRLQRRSA